MGQLSARERASLPDRAFAYIDSRGRRRLPIHDEAHVRNALARFSRVAFEDEAARERARERLLVAAKKYGIVPIGFITGQLRSERGKTRAGAPEAPPLPTGYVSLLMTDIEASTALVHRLGDRYRGLLNDVRGATREAVSAANGREVDVRADEFFAVFKRAGDAVGAGAAIQRALVERAWPDGIDIRVRAGIHTGRPTLTDSGYIGLAVNTVARICAAAHGGQILVSARTRSALRRSAPDGIELRNLGRFRLAGLPEAQALFQVVADGLLADFPPLRIGEA
jgi:class 3 adenylate cyclase